MKKIIAAALCFLILSSARATVINVPDGAPTIQAGINLASSGDTVLVADGVYTGDGNRDISFGGKNIVLLSENGPDVTIIDCEGNSINPHIGFYIHEGEDTTAIIDGFTVTGAYSTEWSRAGIACDQASPKVKNCVIRDNHGNGIRYNRAICHISGCVISNNSNLGVIVDESPAIISNSAITSNGWVGIYWNAQWYGYHFETTDCLVRDNLDMGMYLLVGSGTFHVQSCTFVGNKIGMTYDWNFPKVADATISSLSDTSFVEDCLSAYNTTYGFVSYIWAGYVILRCNNAYGNGTEDYHDVGVGPEDDYDNISENPLFCDPANDDFTLYSNSPCLPENNACGVLIGALGEGCNCCALRGDTDGSGQVDILDLEYLIEYLWLDGPSPLCGDDADADGSGAMDLLDLDYVLDFLFRDGPEPVACE